MTLEEIPDLEKLFEINVFIYSLEPTADGGEEGDENNEDKPETAASLLFHLHHYYGSTMYLNVHKNYFS